MANIRHIAKLAGVSVSTVSRVLNGHPYVREEKRLAVEQAMNSLNYARNMNAVHLLRGRTDMIGVMLPSINHPYFSKLVEGISDEALQAGCRLVLCQTGYAEEEERNALHMVKEKQIDGLILCSKALGWDEIVPYAAFGSIVACGEDAGGLLPSVFIDHYASFRAGIRHVMSKGHTRIGLALSRYASHSSDQRRQAYWDAITEIGEQHREDWTFYDCYGIEDGAQVVRQLHGMAERPTAMLVTGDQVAAGMIAEAAKLGIRVPDDLAILGFDNQPIAHVLGITTIDNQLHEMGREAFRMLQVSLLGEEPPVSRVEIPFALVERTTV
ncbi:DNA-binding LacI/PurR family transcriptional regulator [Paenibacillus phyllosphaerae]|uniref:DNA-binding LacI/PurR family transcriptional regulator n=1 Tax=Paenibacillus phyllosphaerae TaxID=274593 RepID=A0A7W5FQ23_9BACL|nr:LacI family DNA-binding transcriptional regulator [Paenibacillus phyllosphaerae]MBB3112990.1 DNA-binding LacI/PurR family transcriptional regulator [Paenibacillus phyllosphaerae]